MDRTNFAKIMSGFLICILLFTGCTSGKLFDGTKLQAGDKLGTQLTDTPDVSDMPGDLTDSPSNGGNDNITSGNDGGLSNDEPDGNADAAEPDPGPDTETLQEAQKPKEPIKVKALYLTGWIAGGTKNLNHYVELANNTEINSYVVDIKDDDGYVGYESQLPEVQANGTWKKKYNVDNAIKAFHDNGIYVIGRLVAFKDPVYSLKRPDLAIKNVSGGLWKDNEKKTWINPYNKESWKYLVDIAKEAVEKGFDEIQFDYVRFPSDGKKKNMDFSGVEQEKYQAICEFLAYAKAEIPDVPISADLFAIIFESPADTEGIGQYLEHVGKDVDYISPMAYPSHYAYGQIVNKVRFEVPDLEPYAVVYNTLVKGRNRIEQVSDYKAKVRPYLQDFTASWLRPKNGKKMYQEYGAEQVRQQIKAVYDAGYDEWILWDAGNKYSEDALLKE